MSKVIIKTYDDLTAERERLEALLIIHRQKVKDDWSGVKGELEPVSNVFGAVGKMTHSDKSHPLVNLGLKFASDILLKNFVLAKAGWVARLAVPFVMKNYSSHMIAENGKGLFSKLKGIGKLFKPRKKVYHDELAEEDSQLGGTDQNGQSGRY